MSTSQLASAVADIAPTLQANIRSSEDQGFLARESVEALQRSGLYRLWQPLELGGFGASLAEAIQVNEQVAAIDASAAWNLGVGALHNGFVAAYLSDAAVQEVFAGSEVIIAGQMGPLGQARLVDGGLQISGNWSFGSGINQSNWLIGGAMLFDGDKLLYPICAVFRIELADVDEASWQVAGLSATGSRDYCVKDLFIPQGFWFQFPACQPARGGAVYELTVMAQNMLLHASVPLGAAQHALNEITELARTKKRVTSKKAVADSEAFQKDLGQATMQLKSARLYIYDVARRLDEVGGGTESAQLLSEARAATRYVTDVAFDIATFAYRAGGGDAMRLQNELQRVMRDLMGASQHIYIEDQTVTQYGAALLQETSAAPVGEPA